MIDYKSFFNSGSKTDKITHHGYHRIYPWFLNHLLLIEDVNVLEIGVDEQGSIKLWKDFFIRPKITVIDILEKDVQDVEFVLLDQSDKFMLSEFANRNMERYHLIIDDGSHVPDHQELTLVHLWKALKPGGIFIVEDIETSYWAKSEIYGYKFNGNKSSFINKTVQSLDRLNKEFLPSKKKIKNKIALMEKLMDDVEMVSFAYNCVIFIKKNVEFNQYYERPYRFSWQINRKSFIEKCKIKLGRILKKK